jgi:hypothetical protein
MPATWSPSTPSMRKTFKTLGGRASHELLRGDQTLERPLDAELYPKLTARLCDLFHRASAIDRECSHINREAPAGEYRRLRGVELTARGLDSFGISAPQLTETMKLPGWPQSDRMIWPPPQVPLAVLVAESMRPPDDPRFGPNWGAAREQDMARRAATEARWANEEEARQAESKRAYEASLQR